MESKIWHKWAYLWNKNRLTDMENRLVVAKGVWGGRGMNWERGVSRCQLLHIKWINNRSYCRAQGTTFNILWQTIPEKYFSKNAYMCKMSYFVAQQKLTHCKSTILQFKSLERNFKKRNALSCSNMQQDTQESGRQGNVKIKLKKRTTTKKKRTAR